MPSVAYRCHVLGKRLQTVSGDEPCRLDVVLLEKLQKALRANSTSEQTPTDVTGAVFSSITTQPTCESQLENDIGCTNHTANRIHVDTI
jgi:hypothetical protein